MKWGFLKIVATRKSGKKKGENQRNEQGFVGGFTVVAFVCAHY